MAIDIGFNFGTFLFLEFIVVLPIVIYNIYWSFYRTRGSLSKKDAEDLMFHLKWAYILISVVTVYIPSLLVYFLYVIMQPLFPTLFVQFSLVLLVFIILFEVLNYHTFYIYGKSKIRRKTIG